MNRAYTEKTPFRHEPERPPLASLGDCLAKTASYKPVGFAKITAVNRDELALRLEADTACIFAAPVTIYIREGVSPEHAREVLKAAARCLKNYESLQPWTPEEFPQSAPFVDDDTIPF
jgi:hypothetical protein